ncbi:MAG: class I SAM-dependent methyltransferase [Dehalococcoidia bacterium]
MMKCRVCETDCKMFLDLGWQPIANNFIARDQFPSEPFYHLQVFFCPSCFTVQLGECPEGRGVFNENYPFFTGTSQGMIKHFVQFSELIKEKYLPANGTIMEIGSNDGTFLEHFKNWEHMGFDPSESVTRVARSKGISVYPKPFETFPAKDSKRWHGATDVFISANTFAHIPDRHGVLRNIKIMLAQGGVWINEEPYLRSIIDKLAYDQIYNEHIFYTSIASMRNALNMHHLEIIDFEILPTHGGSIRYFIGHKRAEDSNGKIDQAVEHEGLNSFDVFQHFGQAVQRCATEFKKNLLALKRPVVGYGAAAKSTTVLNYCDIGPDIVSKIYDTTPEKQGKFSPGKHIPVVSYSQFAEDDTPDVVLFVWNHGREIYDKERYRTRNWLLPVGGAA